MPRPKVSPPRKASAGRSNPAPKRVAVKAKASTKPDKSTAFRWRPDKPGTNPKARRDGKAKRETTKVVARRPLYDLVEQTISMPGQGSVDVRSYVNKQGTPIDTQHKLGRKTGLVRLIEKRQIEAVKAQPSHSNCSIGKGEDGTWFGWSHRAVCGFKKGDKVFEERYGDDKTPFVKHGRKTIRSDADGRLAAKRFARSVS